ncbi:MAG TPA: transposase family protein, partial [Myxococcales bacterium]
GFDEVADPRKGPIRWRLGQLLVAVVVGAMAGCRSLREVEELTENLSRPLRLRLGFNRRQPDTTLREALCKLSVDEMRACLHRLVYAAWRRKALEPVGLPFGVLALDGKSTALPCWDGQYVQQVQPETGLPYGLARTVTCTLVSAAGRPCLDAIPIPAKTNEMGHFRAAFDSVFETYGRLFRVVSYDAGALSQENAQHVVASGKEYLLALKNEQRTMVKLAEEMLDPAEAVAETVDVLDNHTTVTRRLVLLTVNQNWAYGNGKGAMESVWQHARTFLRVESVLTKDGVAAKREARLFVSSLTEKALTPDQWLRLVRGHWGVEVNHNALDTAFAEDRRPWIAADGNGMLVALVLRRIAYTMLTLFRSVSLRGEQRGEIAWASLMRWVWQVAVAATDAHLAAIRPRGAAVWS